VHNTVDYARIGDDYYSDKAPGVSFLGIPLYAALKPVLELRAVNSFTEQLSKSEAFQDTLRANGSGVSTEKVRFAIAQIVLSFTVSAIPSALLCALLYVVAVIMTGSSAAAIATALAYGLLSPTMPYANTFMGHQLAAALLFASFALIYLAPSRLGVGRLLLLGLLLGYAVVTEYPAFLPAGAIFLFALFELARRKQPHSILFAALSGGVIAALWMGYNTTVFGSPLELGYSHSELWTEQHQTGFMSLTTPSLRAIWGITFSPFRGLFPLSPWLLLAFPGYILWWKQLTERRERAALLTSVTCILSIFLFNSASSMWWGGFAVGPRYLLPMLPFLALGCAFSLATWGRAIWCRLLVSALFLWSFLAVWGQSLADQAFPADTSQNPWASHVLPAWREGNLARSAGTLLGLEGLGAFVPLLLIAAGIGLAWWYAVQRSSTQLDSAPKAATLTAPGG
jgi:hypothetical protein